MDKPGGAGIVDCQRLSHEAGDVLDVSGLIPESYDLEVSSPGLDRELRTDREFAWAVGRDVRCWMREPVDGRLEFAGRLEGAGPERLAIAAQDGQTAEVPRALLTKVGAAHFFVLYEVGGARRWTLGRVRARCSWPR